MTLREARKIFKDEIATHIPQNDTAALNEAFNNWTDALCKSGEITERQYNTWTRK